MKRLKRLFAKLGLSALAVSAFFSSALPAQAAATCPTMETLETGQHCSFDVAGKGVVHVWKPSNYDANTASIIVYQHGDTSSTDATWAQDNLPSQYRQSGVNALFITPRGPKCGCPGGNCCSDSTVRWTTLESLLTAVSDKIGALPSGNIEVIGHSNAIRTTKQTGWLNHPRLTHIIALDTLYEGVTAYKNWLKASVGHRMLLIGIVAQYNTGTNSIAVAKSIDNNLVLDGPGDNVPNSYSALSDAAKGAQALYLKSDVGHHDMPDTQIKSMASFIGGSAGPAPEASAPVTAPVAVGSAPTVSKPLLFNQPKLQIDIPGLSFTDAIQEDGTITFPWLGQYISGVYAFLASIVGSVAAVVIMIGGFQYLTAAGDKSKVDAAKKRIRGAMLGMVIVLGSYVMLFTINPDLVDFKGFQLAEIAYVPIEGVRPDVALEGLSEPEQQAAATEQKASGQTPCNTDAGCLAYCKTLGCTIAKPDLCKPDVITADIAKFKAKGKTLATGTIVNSYCGLSCDESKIPTSAPGFPLFDVATELRKAGATKIYVLGSAKATQGAITGLLGIEKQLNTEKFKDYEVGVSNCFRDYKQGIKNGCTSLVAGDKMRELGDNALANKFDENTPSIAAYPGSSPHGFGYACDMILYQNVDGKKKQLIVIDSEAMCNPIYKERVEKFDEIVFPTGAQRYYGEIWHYEWGNPNKSARCGTAMNVACVWPPPPCNRRK
jgi:hypothetical protein